MRGRLVDLVTGRNGRQRVTVELDSDFRNSFDALASDDVDFSVKRWREKRSLDANGYLWWLVTEIGNRLRMSKDDVYLDMLKRYGQGGAVSVEERFAGHFRRSYKYHEELGRSELHGKTFVHFRFWVGSSEYDTEEMSILLDGVIQEARELGIDTDTPAQRARLQYYEKEIAI